ncbi:MAG: glutamate-5-semialdehyde dehydrogenase [Nannocystaceae bacterium]|nr:glutamate-5-semialdehyde dehydrogenase [Nannocystaceae bacterium]
MSAEPGEDRERIVAIARAARRAGHVLGRVSGPERRAVLLAMADALERPGAREAILRANAADLADAKLAVDAGELTAAAADRLPLDERKLGALVEGLRHLAGQPDPLGRVSVDRDLDDELNLRRVACPLGVIAVVFEARPDAVPQIVGLAMRSGNAVVLKGGKEAVRSNRALCDVLRTALVEQGFDPDAIALLEHRTDVDTLITLERDIDLVVARGSAAFVHHVQRHSRVPVLAHAEGVCHLVIDAAANPVMAARIAVDAKCSYPAACNAIETLLWLRGAQDVLDGVVTELRRAGVTLRACERTRALHPELVPARPQDFGHEFGALELAIRGVDDLAGALEHIERHGSRHTECIVTDDEDVAAEFLANVDAACVFHNASTRFADGYRFGLGAELGISTSKLGARGPVGAEGLVTYRWLLRGTGQVASDYAPGKRRFRHRNRT